MEGQGMKINMSSLEKRILRYGGLVFCVMVTVLCLGLVGNASAASYNLTLTSSGAQSINAPGAGGAVISSDSINVATTCRSGYNFTINTSVNDNNLYLGGDASQNELGKYFTPADGTTTLANSTNTWGYYYNASDPSTAPTSSNIFSPVPTLNNPATVISPRVTPSSTDINDNFNIYYGVSVSPSMPVGTYKMIPEQKIVGEETVLVDGTIVYTATIADDCIAYTVHYDPSSIFEGNTITGSGTVTDQKIYNGVSTPLTSSVFTAPTVGGTQYYFAGWNTKQDGTGALYLSGQAVTDLAKSGETITLYALWTNCQGKTKLYDLVACRSKGYQTVDEVNSAINMNNSGVYKYDTTVFGGASDDSGSRDVYYYRGILDSDLDDTNIYGSGGDGRTYPNYVKLDDTCWRIIRTTKSGGVKMIYNGSYSGGTTPSSCSNTLEDAQINKMAFAVIGNSAKPSDYWVRNINRVGYSFNNDVSLQDSTTQTSTSTVFGNNTTDSNVKDYIENEWFSKISSFSNKMEPSAGYCADRTVYSLNDSNDKALTTIAPYSTATFNTYFGAIRRTRMDTPTPSLTCPLLRRSDDLYTTDSADNGNNLLTKPVALLTFDEVKFAGEGDKSFLRSGSFYWLLSPSSRASAGHAYVSTMSASGKLNNSLVSASAVGVRPVISLNSTVTKASGSGTAIDPWVVTP